MAKITDEVKKTYAEKISVYKDKIEDIRKNEKKILATINPKAPPHPHKYFNLSENSLCLTSHLILLNNISQALLGIKNENFLNAARKSCYDSTVYLEKIVTSNIDVPFSELEENWKVIEDISDIKRYEMICKMGFAIDSIIEGFGDNSKRKWSFVNLRGRHAVLSKNIINFRTIIAGMDPRLEGYSVRYKMLELVKQLLNKSANDFRLKYELSTNSTEDFLRAIEFLMSLVRIHIILGETDKVEQVKKKITLWKQKMEDDSLKQKASI